MIALIEKPKKEKKKNYINNKDFYNSYCEWKAKGYEGNIPEDIIMNFYKLANSIACSKNFINYSNLWLEEMISEAFFLCIQKAKMFNPEKSNSPFSYYTSVIRNSFIMFIKNAKRNKIYDRDVLFDLIERQNIT